MKKNKIINCSNRNVKESSMGGRQMIPELGV